MPTARIPESVVFRSFGTETVMLNLTTGQYHGLKGSGGRMLEVLVETPDIEAAARRIAAEYGHPVEQVQRDMRELCAALADRSLIEIDGADTQQ